MIDPPDVRQARRVIAAHRRQQRKAQPRAKPDSARQRRQRDPGYLAFLRRQPCCVGPRGCSGAVEAAHIRFADSARQKPLTGMQTKPDDRWALPLCRAHHRDGPDAQHRGSERRWWERRGLDPLALAERLYKAYRTP